MYKKYLQQCKEIAEPYLDKGDLLGAWRIFSSEMSDNEETRDLPTFKISKTLAISGQIDTKLKMRNLINGII